MQRVEANLKAVQDSLDEREVAPNEARPDTSSRNTTPSQHSGGGSTSPKGSRGAMTQTETSMSMDKHTKHAAPSKPSTTPGGPGNSVMGTNNAGTMGVNSNAQGRGMPGEKPMGMVDDMGARPSATGGATASGMGPGKSLVSRKKDMGRGKGKRMGQDMMGGTSGGASMGMCCGPMGSMMGKPKTMTQADSSVGVDPPSSTGHVLHLGERDFYLDRRRELALTEAQVRQLTAHRSHWLTEREQREAAIDSAETRLWQLTQAVAPNPDQVAAAVRDVERLRSEQRLAFIESVSAAVSTLTPAQIARARSFPYGEVP